MKKYRWLVERKEKDGTRRYYLRARVPKDIVDAIGKQEIKRSLGTANLAEARRKIALAAIEVEELFERARRSDVNIKIEDLADSQITNMVVAWFATRERENIAGEFGLAASDDRGAALISIQEDLAYTADLQDPSSIASVQAQADALLIAAGVASGPITIGSIVSRTMVAHVDKSSPKYILLCHLVRRAMIEESRRCLARLRDQDFGARFDPQFVNDIAVVQAVSHVTAKVTLKDLVEQYLSEPIRKVVTDKTRLGREAMFDLLQEFLGEETSISDVTRGDARRMRDLLMQLPPNGRKSYPDTSVEEVAMLNERRNGPVLSLTTVKSYVSVYSRLFRFAQLEHELDRNPFEELGVVGNQVSEKERRKAFTIDDLNKIFQAPLYTGCVDDKRGWAKPGPNVIRRGRFWLPLISLYSGMRLDEIASLKTSSVSKRDDVDVFVIEESEGRSLKNEPSNRIVPIHPELVKCGILDYAAETKLKGEAQFFPELTESASGSRTPAFSKWFSRFAIVVGVKSDPSLSFHSFRHTFRDGLAEGNVTRDAVLQLGGWAGGDVVDRIYGGGLKPRTLLREISKVTFEGVDFGHLYIENP